MIRSGLLAVATCVLFAAPALAQDASPELPPEQLERWRNLPPCLLYTSDAADE